MERYYKVFLVMPFTLSERWCSKRVNNLNETIESLLRRHPCICWCPAAAAGSLTTLWHLGHVIPILHTHVYQPYHHWYIRFHSEPFSLIHVIVYIESLISIPPIIVQGHVLQFHFREQKFYTILQLNNQCTTKFIRCKFKNCPRPIKLWGILFPLLW